MSIRSRLAKLERDCEPTDRLNIGRLLMIGTGDAEPTPDEQAQLEELARQLEATPYESIDEQLERLIAEISNLPDAAPADSKGGEKPEYGLKELPKQSSC